MSNKLRHIGDVVQTLDQTRSRMSLKSYKAQVLHLNDKIRFRIRELQSYLHKATA